MLSQAGRSGPDLPPSVSVTGYYREVRILRRAGKARLQHEHARGLRVLQQIDSAVTTKD
jgi:hypothetical protein